MSRRSAVAALSLAVCTATLSTGCSSFYTRSTSLGTTYTRFDDGLHDALSEVFEACTEPLDIEAGLDEIDFVGACTTADTTSAEADLLVALLTANGPIPLAEPIDDDLVRFTPTVSGFPWPMQNCEIDFTVDVDLFRLRMLNLETEWRTHDGRPSMHIDFDFNSPTHVVDVLLDANVRCPSAINDAALQATLDALLPNNRVEMDLTGMDLDLDVEFTVSGGRLNGTLDTNLNIGGVNVNNVFVDIANALGFTEAEIMDAFGLTFDELEAEIEPMLDDALVDLADEVADTLMMSVPAGHSVTGVALVSVGGVNNLRIASR
jgi:hypothetical protein